MRSLGWRDLGSLGNPCWPRGGNAQCKPGCPKPFEWCEQVGGMAAQHGCKAHVHPSEQPCCVAFAPDSWIDLLAMQDAHMPKQSCRATGVDCDNFFNKEVWYYNEVSAAVRGTRARHCARRTLFAARRTPARPHAARCTPPHACCTAYTRGWLCAAIE